MDFGHFIFLQFRRRSQLFQTHSNSTKLLKTPPNPVKTLSNWSKPVTTHPNPSKPCPNLPNPTPCRGTQLRQNTCVLLPNNRKKLKKRRFALITLLWPLLSKSFRTFLNSITFYYLNAISQSNPTKGIKIAASLLLFKC